MLNKLLQCRRFVYKEETNLTNKWINYLLYIDIVLFIIGTIEYDGKWRDTIRYVFILFLFKGKFIFPNVTTTAIMLYDKCDEEHGISSNSVYSIHFYLYSRVNLGDDFVI